MRPNSKKGDAMRGGLDIQGMRHRAEKWERWGDDEEGRQIAADVLALLERVENIKCDVHLWAAGEIDSYDAISSICEVLKIPHPDEPAA